MAALGCVVAVISRVRRRLLRARGVDLAGVETPPLLRIGEQIIGDADLLEPLLRLLVARIEIRVQLLGELSIGAADFVGRGGLGDAEGFVRVFHTRIRRGRDRSALAERRRILQAAGCVRGAVEAADPAARRSCTRKDWYATAIDGCDRMNRAIVFEMRKRRGD